MNAIDAAAIHPPPAEIRLWPGEAPLSVTNPEPAETQLLKLLVNAPVVVTEFRRKQYELEDIFMQIVEGDLNVRK